MDEIFSSYKKFTLEIPIEHLDYSYIGICKDKNEIYAILKLLKSGKEGKYEKLEEFTENKLIELLDPLEKKRYTALTSKPSEEDIQKEENDLYQFIDKMKENPTNLVRGLTLNDEKLNELGMSDYGKIPKEYHKVYAEKEKEKGNEHFRVKDYEKSIYFYSRSLIFDCSNAIVYSNRCQAYLNIQQYEKAEEDGSCAIEIDPNYVKGWLRRGKARFCRGYYADAIKDYRSAQTLDPSLKEIPKLLDEAEKKLKDVGGRTYETTDSQPTPEVVKPKQEEKPKYKRIQIQEDDDDDETPDDLPLEEQLDKLLKHITTSPSDLLPTLLEVVKIEMKLLKYNDAIIHCNSYLQQDQNAEIYLYRSQCFGELGNYKEAIGDCTIGNVFVKNDTEKINLLHQKEILEKKLAANIPPAPTTPTPQESLPVQPPISTTKTTDPTISSDIDYKEKGNSSYKNKQYEEAIGWYTKGIDVSPNAALYRNRAACYLALNKFQETIDDCTKSIEFNDSDKNIIKSYHRRGVAYREIKDYKKAIKDFECVLSFDENNSDTRSELIKTRGLEDREKKRVEQMDNISKISQNIISKVKLPDTPPKTVYEFRKHMQSFKSKPELFGEYLLLLTPTSFSKLLKASLDPEMLQSLLSGMNCVAKEHPDWTLDILESISTFSTFSTSLMMLPREGLALVPLVFQNIPKSERRERLEKTFT